MSRHFTHRFWLCALFGFGSAVATLVTRSLEPVAVGAPFLTVLALSLVDGWWPTARVGVPTVSAARVIEGDELSFTFDLHSERKLSWVDLEVQFPATLTPLGSARFVASVHGTKQFTIPVEATRWGASGPEWAVVTTRDRFGVTERVARHPLHVPVRVHPPGERLTSLVPLHRQRPVTGDHRSRRTGSGSELAEVRPYRFGDPIRMIHPRLSQRRGTPMVVERHPDQSSDVVLVIDSAQDLGVDLDTTLRWTVTAATALTERHLRVQDRVGLLDIGRGVRWIPARLGRRHLHTVVDTLLSTEVLPRDQRGHVFTKPTNLPRSAAIVAISPMLTELILTALVDLRSTGHDVLVIKPTLPYNEADVSQLARRIFRVGNELNERWLIERGVIVVPWWTGDSLEHVMRRVVNNLGRARQRV